MSNVFSHLRAASALGAILLTAGAAAHAGPTDLPPNLAVDIDAPGAARAFIDVTIPKVKAPLHYELGLKDGLIAGGIYIPAGKERYVSITAFDERGEKLYTGAGYATVDEKLTAEIAITMEGRDSKDPLTSKLGTYRLEVGFGTNKSGYLLQATLFDALGKQTPFKPDDIKWGFPGFELLPYSCFETSLCIDFNKPDFSITARLACYRDITCWDKKPKDTRGPYASVAVGINHTCALTIAGDVRCWGDNQFGQLGATTGGCSIVGYACSRLPVPVVCPAGEVCKFVAVTAGGDHTCAIDTANKTWCWGEDGVFATGETSGPNMTQSPAHRQVTAVDANGAPLSFVAVDTEVNHTCALATTSDVYCWGSNDHQQMGMPTSALKGSRAATLVPGGHKYRRVSVGLNHTCAVQDYNAGSILDCWGDNFDSQISSTLPGAGLNGFTVFANASAAVPMLHGRGVERVTAGPTSTCAENDNSDTICWGSSQTFSSSTAGFRVLHYSYATSMATHSDTCQLPGVTVACVRTCETAAGSDLYCGNWVGTVGSTLSKVGDPPNSYGYVVWDLVDVGPNHVCALTNQRDIWCFGINKFGQFGTGVDSTTRVDVPFTAVDRLDPPAIATLLMP